MTALDGGTNTTGPFSTLPPVADPGTPTDLPQGEADTPQNITSTTINLGDNTEGFVYFNITPVENQGVLTDSVNVDSVTVAGNDNADFGTISSNSGVTVVYVNVNDVDGDGSVTITDINLSGFDTSNAPATTGITYDVNASTGSSADSRFDSSNGNAPGAESAQSDTFAITGASSDISGFIDPLPRGTITDNTATGFVNTGANDVAIGDLSFSTAGNVTNVTVNATGGANGSIAASAIDSVTVELYGDGSLIDSETRDYGSHNVTVGFGAAQTNVDRIVVRADFADTADQPQTVDAFLYVQTNPTGTVDTQGTQTLNDDKNGFFSGRVSDPQNNDIANAVVNATRDSDGLRVNTTTNSDGEYTLEAPPGNYTLTANATNFQTSQPKDGEIVANETTTANFVLQPKLFPETITVTPKQDQAFVGQNNTFTVTVEDQNGDPLSGETVIASAPDPITFVGASEKTTDSNGQVTFTVTSTEIVAGAEITFTTERNSRSGEEVSTTATKSFIQNGNGEIDGTVQNSATTDPVENASVWTVLSSQFNQSSVTNVEPDTGVIPSARLNLTTLGDGDATVFVRLVDNDTGEVIDVDDYRVQTYNESGTAVRKVRELNTSNASVGGGFVVADTNGDGEVQFVHTRLDPEEYVAQVSFTAPQNSEIDEFGDAANPPEDFSTEFGPFSPTANLTLQATKERATAADANLVDAPGFINSFGEDTGGTNEFGQFKLNELYTDFQDGRAYVVIATKGGFSTEFGDVYVQEDGTGFDESDVEGLNIEPIPVEAEQVNIIQVGTHPPLSALGPNQSAGDLLSPFADQSDATFQQVPRDGETLDIIQVETRTDTGELVNGTAIIEIDDSAVAGADDNLTGSFIAAIGANDTVVSTGEDTITVNTGEDGTALVAYSVDESRVTVDTFKQATLTNDRSATDRSNVTFVGTLIIDETGSLSGIVTNEANEPLSSTTVYANEFTVKGQQFVLEPVGGDATLEGASSPLEVLNATWRISAVGSSENFTVKGYNLTTESVDRRFDVESSLGVEASDGLREFPISFVSLQGAAADDGLTLLTFSSEAASGQYTLPRVPADDVTTGGVTGATYEVVRAAQIQAGANIETGNGDSIAEGVQPGQTQEANVVIPGVEPLGVTVDIVEPADGANVSQGQSLDVVVALENQNVVTSQSRSLTVTLDGTEIGSSESVTIGPGATENVTVATTVPSDQATGEAPLQASTGEAGETDLVTVTVQEAAGPAAQYDADDDGEIDLSEVNAVIADFEQGEIGIGLVNEVIAAFESGSGWSSVSG